MDEALCFGWIDSTRKKLDSENTIQYFTQRKPQSTCSKVDKLKVEKLIGEGKKAEQGMKIIALAKQNGSWNVLDSVEELNVPEDLEKELAQDETAYDFFSWPEQIGEEVVIVWLVSAKRPETREKQIKEIAENAAGNYARNSSGNLVEVICSLVSSIDSSSPSNRICQGLSHALFK